MRYWVPIAAGDIGRHFPDTDPQFKGVDSRIYCEMCLKAGQKIVAFS